jgi:hypothetical protein
MSILSKLTYSDKSNLPSSNSFASFSLSKAAEPFSILFSCSSFFVQSSGKTKICLTCSFSSLVGYFLSNHS